LAASTPRRPAFLIEVLLRLAAVRVSSIGETCFCGGPFMPDWQIITGDRVAELGPMEPGTARLVFADPSSNIGADYGDGFDDRRSPAGYPAWSRRWIEAAARLLTPDGSPWLPVNHAWLPHLRLAMDAAGPPVPSR
jgi:hypothetical protein